MRDRGLSGEEIFREKLVHQRLAQQLGHVPDSQTAHEIEAMHFDGAHADP